MRRQHDVYSYIVKRTQIYLDEGQDERLGRRASAAGTTKSDLIRRAIDAFLAATPDDAARLQDFRAAVREAAGSAPSLPDGADYIEALRKGDVDRLEDLDGAP